MFTQAKLVQGYFPTTSKNLGLKLSVLYHCNVSYYSKVMRKVWAKPNEKGTRSREDDKKK
jgi:hypothetical protein